MLITVIEKLTLIKEQLKLQEETIKTKKVVPKQ
jgi:hypothetical protein